MNLSDILNKVKNKDCLAFFYTPKIFKEGKSVLFRNPSKVVEINSYSEFEWKIEQIQNELENDKVGFALINYEAGYLFEKKFYHLLTEVSVPLMKFFLFDKDEVQYFNHNDIQYYADKDWEYRIKKFRLNVTKEEYLKNIHKIKNYIKEGDTYQVNYTLKGKFKFEGNVVDLFTKLVFNQSAKYSAIINDDSKTVISISPELFFSVNGNKISAHPMKGTMHRGRNNEEDKRKKNELKLSEKNKAENTMILDLLRNDLGRISEIDTVEPEKIHKIETYESLHQMVSIVNAEINSNKLFKIFKNLFPCGSITGAPKVRTMEIINELEKEERGLYTGTIGLIGKGKYDFNIPIRTIEIDERQNGKIGIGSGIVWDSDPVEEFEEVKLKANFLTKSDNYFELFETMLVENGEICLIENHFERLKESAEYFLFNFDQSKIEIELFEYLQKLDSSKEYRLKLKLSKWGEIKIESKEITGEKKEIKIAISKTRIYSENKFQYFKTTNRKLYDDEFFEYKKNGYDEVIYLNEKGELAEGAITNIFLFTNENWFTPKIQSGILDGCYRKYFIKNNNVHESKLNLDDLKSADRILLTNSVRKELLVKEVWMDGKIFKSFDI